MANFLDNTILDARVEIGKMIGLKGYDFRIKRTLLSASADVPVDLLTKETVQSVLRAIGENGRGVILDGFIMAVTGGDGAVDLGDLVIQDTAANALVTLAAAGLTANAYKNENSSGLTLTQAYRLKERIADLEGLQVTGSSTGGNDDVVVEVWGRIV